MNKILQAIVNMAGIMVLFVALRFVKNFIVFNMLRDKFEPTAWWQVCALPIPADLRMFLIGFVFCWAMLKGMR